MEIVNRQGHLPEKEPDGVSSLISVPSETGMVANSVAHQADEKKDASKPGLQPPGQAPGQALDQGGDAMTPTPGNQGNDASSDSNFEGIGDHVIAENIAARRELERTIGSPEYLELVAALKREFPEIYAHTPKFGNDD